MICVGRLLPPLGDRTRIVSACTYPIPPPSWFIYLNLLSIRALGRHASLTLSTDLVDYANMYDVRWFIPLVIFIFLSFLSPFSFYILFYVAYGVCWAWDGFVLFTQGYPLLKGVRTWWTCVLHLLFLLALWASMRRSVSGPSFGKIRISDSQSYSFLFKCCTA